MAQFLNDDREARNAKAEARAGDQLFLRAGRAQSAKSPAQSLARRVKHLPQLHRPDVELQRGFRDLEKGIGRIG